MRAEGSANVASDFFQAAVGARIREVREEKGISRQELADLLGIRYQSLANIEYGTVGLSFPTFFAIAGHLDVRPAELLPENGGNGG